MGRGENRRRYVVLMIILLLLAGCGRSDQTVLPSEEPGAQSAMYSEEPGVQSAMYSEELGVQTVLPSEELGAQTVEEPMPVISAAPLLTWEDPDNENLAAMLQRECGGMMVQLEAGQYLGSGVIYSADEDSLVIVTASHVLADAGGSVKVTFMDRWVAESDDYLLWEQLDLAIVRLAMEQIPEERLIEYRLANIDRDAYDKLQEGDGCIVMGSRSGAAEEAYEGTVLKPWIYMEDYGHYMIWVKAYGEPGMSGGGLFDRRGHFLGILSGIGEDDEWAVVPLPLLLEAL